MTAQMKRALTADHGNQASRLKLPPSFICSLAMLYLHLYNLRKTSYNKKINLIASFILQNLALYVMWLFCLHTWLS